MSEASSKMDIEDSTRGLESCLKFLKGNSDEQRLVGLLLATKFTRGDDKDAVLQIFDAIGVQFINRLLKSGVSVSSQGTKEQEDPYLELATSILSAFCRIPELAALDEIIDKIPTLLEILVRRPKDTITADCLECVLSIASTSKKGLLLLRKHGDFPLLLECIWRPELGSPCLHLSVKITLLLMSGNESGTKTVSTVPASIRKYSEPDWLNVLRSGIGGILQRPTDVEQKLLALEITKSMVDFFGSKWLLGPMLLPEENKATPLDRFFLLLVETLRVETLVLLNEVARSRFCTTDKSDDDMKRQHLLATCYSLLESAIEVTLEEDDNERLSNAVLSRIVSILNEVINTVIEFLQEAKKQSISKGDDILASSRLLSRYLADAVSYLKDLRKQFSSLLEYLFTVTSDSEESPFLVVQFVLPVVCEITREESGCEGFVSWGGHKQVVSFMLKVVQETCMPSGLLVKASDVILNVLENESRLAECLTPIDFVPLLEALPSWAESKNECMEVSMAACVCVKVLDLTSEKALLQWTSMEILSNVYKLLIDVLQYVQRVESLSRPAEEQDLWDLTLTACTGLIGRYPSLRDRIKSFRNMHCSSSSTHILLSELLEKAG